MAFIRGKNLRLYKHTDGGGNVEIGCSTECELAMETALREVTGYSSDKNREFKPDINQWSVSTRGLISTGISYGFQHYIQDWIAQTKFTVKFAIDADTEGTWVFEGFVYITSVSLSGANGAVGSFNLSAQGTGTPSITNSITPPSTSGDVNRYAYTATGGETSIVVPDMIGANALLSVMRGGSDIGDIITSGTPVNNEKKFLTSTGTTSWAADKPAVAGEFFVLLWK